MHKEPITFKQKLSLAYLWLVPPVTVAIGFGIAPISYKIYLPVWGLNVCLMIISAYHLGVGRLWKRDHPGKQLVITALLLLLPWLLFSIFAGMGPPPSTFLGWVNKAAEQQTRYTILMAGGFLLLLGTTLLKTQLQASGENLYSTLAFATVSIAIPLFMINMAFWGYYLTDAFRLFVAHPAAKHPDWNVPIESLFYVISVAEVALTYLGALFFAASLKITGLLSKGSFRWYLSLSVIAILLVLIPPNWPEPFGIAGYLVAIPAIPFIMYYLEGVRLLKAA
jgi:hypothetical protein